MAFFKFGKKVEKEENLQSEGQSVGSQTERKHVQGIKVLGTGCKKCNDLEQTVRQALREGNLDYEVEHISDFMEIASYGVMSTPALVLGNKVVSVGKVLSKDEVIKFLLDSDLK